ncbi:MAG: 50S ribosomal protein L24 [Parcubacteria group bacterium CG11_big_fil_rev_8_21_14_0_20_39_22]|nr:MAG: 50S ribosomal protein L24 [Parcubacteria group bacterium CG11_big_fil_rev_8_21_14_0_20_39_22]
MKIKKGDNVIMIAGKDKGKTGKVERVMPKLEKVLVDGVNIAKRHRKPTKGGQKGQVVEFPMPVHISNVSLVEGGKPVRVAYSVEGGKKKRISAKSRKNI